MHQSKHIMHVVCAAVILSHALPSLYTPTSVVVPKVLLVVYAVLISLIPQTVLPNTTLPE